MAGKVYLVGAGPGDPGLITQKGVRCLNNADVVIYDYLAAEALLAHAGRAERIYVGKKGGDHTLSQEGINALIVEKARAGNRVVRLKGGDPFIFGRGGEEAEELVEAGVDFEIVPGVTSAIAAPAYAGIPLTHRRFTPTVAFVTGHEDPTKEGSLIDWAGLARGVGTLVFLMGVKNLPNIVDRLVRNGRAAETPAALVRWGTTTSQRTVTGTLSTIVERAREANMKPPAIIIVGGVIGLRQTLNWFENRPLFGRRIVVTRARRQASALVDRLAELGAECLEYPTIEVVPPEDYGPLDRAVAEVGSYDWVVFTSTNGVDYFFDRMEKAGRDTRALGNAGVGAIGPATAARLTDFGIRCDLLPKTYQAESVVEAFADRDIAGKKVLLPRAMQARTVLPEELTKMGADVHEVAAYMTRPVTHGAEALAGELSSGSVDMVTFTSSSTVENFVGLLPGGEVGSYMDRTAAACIGPITADTARGLGIDPALVADEFTIDGLCDAILEHFSGE
ncbi:MAG: uroporphyrinogen-III C-methyltransferase [Desulfatibacillaceae bacterium]